MSGEAASRANPDLPGEQRALAEAVLERARRDGTRVVVVLFSGRPLFVTWLVERAHALLAAWFPGTEAGNSIADLLTGRASPSARTPITWPRALGQVPLFFAQRSGGRPENPKDQFTSRYLDTPNSPLFPFGHGLTYGRFALTDLRVTPQSASATDVFEVTVDVRNEGSRTAEETVFLFTRDLVASVARPVLELKGVAKISLQPGEKGTVQLQLPAVDLRFLGTNLEPTFEAGEIEVCVGPCADVTQLLAARVRLRTQA
jgi:beta-glucosidase